MMGSLGPCGCDQRGMSLCLQHREPGAVNARVGAHQWEPETDQELAEAGPVCGAWSTRQGWEQTLLMTLPRVMGCHVG